MNNKDWHHHITIHILHPRDRDMSRSLAHVRPRPVTRHVVPASVTGPHHRAVLHQYKVTCHVSTHCRYPHLVPLRRCRRGRPVVRLVGEPVGEAAQRGAVRPGEAPLRHEVLEAEPGHTGAYEALEEVASINIYNPLSVLPTLTCTTLFSAADSTLARVPPSAIQLRSADSQSVAPENTSLINIYNKYFAVQNLHIFNIP